MHLDRGTELRDEQERVLGSLAWWRTEPRLDRVVDGLPSRVDKARIKQIGNAVVPFIVEFIGNAILWALQTPAPQKKLPMLDVEEIASMLYEAANPTMRWSYLYPSHNHLHAAVRQRFLDAAARFQGAIASSEE